MFTEALPAPTLPTTRLPVPTNLILAFENDPREILRVDGAVATKRKEELNGIRRFTLPFI